MRAPRALAALLTLLLACAAPASAAHKTSLADVEDEVMCTICGTLLELSSSPQAERERAYINRLIAQGLGKEQIKQALVRQYGRAVLAEPKGSGFDASAYVVPVIGFLLAAAALALGVKRWRRPRRDGGEAAQAGAPGGEEAERLEEDLARYDL